MTLSEISQTRLINQKIENSSFQSPKEIISWMGAIQAQDFSMSKWAIGCRITGSTEKTIESALNDGEIIRTHVLRPTWHLVSRKDIYWMLGLSASRIKASMISRNKQLELTNEIFNKSHQIIEKALLKNNCLTREEIGAELKNVNIKTNENRLSHLLMEAELDQLICSGPMKNHKQTYALLQQRVTNKKILSKEEALAELAKRYFTSRGPATVKDFTWWSGLNVSEAKSALNMVKNQFNSETFDKEEYWFANDILNPEKIKDSVHFLPAFDEFLIAYRDRSASIDENLNKKTISDNGIFRPIIVINGKVAGTWKRSSKKNTLQIDVSLFEKQKKEIFLYIEHEAEKIGHFVEKTVELSYV